MKRAVIACAVALHCSLGWAASEDNPLIATWSFDQAEFTAGDGETGAAWDTQGWVGKDINKIRLLTEGEMSGGSAEGNVRLVFSRAISPFWDLGGGWRREFGGGQQWDAATLELMGILPYYLETRASFSVGDGGQSLLWIEIEYEFNFDARSPRWRLVPEFEMNIYGKDDAERGVGKGLSDLELGLRLHYQIRPDISPYLGVNWAKTFGDTADYARAAGDKSSALRGVVGLRFWF